MNLATRILILSERQTMAISMKVLDMIAWSKLSLSSSDLLVCGTDPREWDERSFSLVLLCFVVKDLILDMEPELK